jgi:hypothetical protein
MRSFLDGILAFIGSSSLTDEEFNTVVLTEAVISKEAYLTLKGILENREGISGQVEKLKSFFLAKGIDLYDSPRNPNSNIFIGTPL